MCDLAEVVRTYERLLEETDGDWPAFSAVRQGLRDFLDCLTEEEIAKLGEEDRHYLTEALRKY